MKKQFPVFLCCLFCISNAFGQLEKFDIATFVSPSGWQRLDSGGVLAFHDYHVDNGFTSFAQIILFPSWTSNDTPMNNFQQEWNSMVVHATGSKTKSAVQSESTPEGWTVVTGSANISSRGMNYTCLLVTLSGFGKAMSVMVNTAGSYYAAAIEKFFNELNLDSKASFAADGQNKIASTPSSDRHGIITLSDYDFIVPEGWQVQNNNDHWLIQNMESGCAIRILTPQPSSGNLEQDAKSVFDMMYAGWNYQQKGEKQYALLRGYLPKGLEYFAKEASMSMTDTDGQYHVEDGTAMVVKASDRIVIISVRHNSSFLAHGDCERKYDTWRRFFNSFTVKNTIAAQFVEAEPVKRIIGVWKQVGTGMALGEYVFAANGHYKFGGAIGSSSTTSDFNYEYLYITTYSFEGDGSYSVKGNQIYLKKRGLDNPEQVQFRFEKVNHGGTGWKDRLYLLQRDSTLGSLYEVCYEKMDR